MHCFIVMNTIRYFSFYVSYVDLKFTNMYTIYKSEKDYLFSKACNINNYLFHFIYIYYWRCIFTFLSNVIGYRRLECLSLYQIMLLFLLFIRFHFENSFMTQTPSLHLCLLLDAFVNGYTEMKNNSIFITV